MSEKFKLSRPKLTAAYTLTFALGYIVSLLLLDINYLRQEYSTVQVILSPFAYWSFATVCVGCLDENIYLSVWLAIPFFLLVVFFITKSFLRLKFRDFMIGQVLLILFMSYPLWYSVLGHALSSAGIIAEYAPWCCD